MIWHFHDGSPGVATRGEPVLLEGFPKAAMAWCFLEGLQIAGCRNLGRANGKGFQW